MEIKDFKESYLQGLKERIAKPITAHNFEYQELGVYIQKKLEEHGKKGKDIWPVFHTAFIDWKDKKSGLMRRSYITEDKVRRAWDVCENRGVYDIKYMIGVLKRL
jgi:hypothetical protein